VSIDLTGARIVWEARDQEPAFGRTFEFAPAHSGVQWVEAEAEWPDGRRAFAVTNFPAQRTDGGQPCTKDPFTKLLINFDDLPDGPLVSNNRWDVTGQPLVTGENLGWMTKPNGKAVKFSQITDGLRIPLVGNVQPSETDAITLSAWLYVERWPYGKWAGPVFAYTGRNGEETILGLNCDLWLRPSAPFLLCGGKMISHAELFPLITLNEWQHYELILRDNNFSLRIDGKLVKSGPVQDAKTLAKQRQDKAPAIKLGNFIGYADEIFLQAEPRLTR